MLLDSCIDKLRREGLSLIILKEGKTLFTSREEGMKPLFEALNILGLSTLRNGVFVDKVMGKAAVLIVSYYRAKEVQCITLSERAKTILEKQGISYYSERLIPEIMNRFGTDICPFEKTVLKTNEPKEGFEQLFEKFMNLKIS